MSLDLSSLSPDEKEELANVLKMHITNFDEVISGDQLLVLPDDVADRIQGHVINSIKRGDLLSEVARFGTVGFVKAFMAMLNPALNPRKFDDEESSDNMP